MIKNVKGFWEIIKEVRYVLEKKERRQAIALLLLMFIGSALELLGVSAIMPFIQAGINPEQMENGNNLFSLAWKMLNLGKTSNPVLFFGAFIAFIYLFKNVFLMFLAKMRYSYTTQWKMNLSVRMFKSYMARPYTFFLNTNSALILRACSEDTKCFFDLLNFLFSLVMEMVTVFVIGVYLLYIDFFTAFCSLIMMILIMGCIITFVKPVMKKAGELNAVALVECNKSIMQSINGIKDILVMQRRQPFIEEYKDAADKERRSNCKRNIMVSLPDRIIEGTFICGIMIIICIRLSLGTSSVVEFVPKLATFAMAAYRLLPSSSKISNAINACMFGKPLLNNVYNNLKEAEKYGYYEDYPDESKEDYKDFTIDISDVSWKYEGQETYVVRNANMKINKGEAIGIIGPSGAGKTTLTDIMLGLLKPQKGSVYINGVDVFSIPKTWAELVAYVPQNVFLLDDTVRANVAFGKKNIDDNDIWDALGKAQISDFVKSLPSGLDTVVGERGVKFSGGQRQRISIARALYNNPQILMMDEATSALDNDTESAVMEAIEALQGQITMIIVAHRLTTIDKCNRVFDVREGKVIEVKHDLVNEASGLE